MSEDQHRRRIVLWLGSFPVIATFVPLTLVLLLSSRTPLVAPLITADLNPAHQVDQSSKVVGLAIEPIHTESP